MSLLGSFFKKSKLNEAIKKAAKARKREGAEADHLFNEAYAGFAEVVAKDLLFSETFYNWGFALLHQAKTKSGEEAVKLYEDAIAKFSFCLTIDAKFMGAAIDGGVALMELARLKGVSANDPLYEQAKQHFIKANSIQAGSASYNLACIHALHAEDEACLSALEDSRDHGSLPETDDILTDSDLESVKSHHWFTDFIASLDQPEEEETEVESPEAETESTATTSGDEKSE